MSARLATQRLRLARASDTWLAGPYGRPASTEERDRFVTSGSVGEGQRAAGTGRGGGANATLMASRLQTKARGGAMGPRSFPGEGLRPRERAYLNPFFGRKALYAARRPAHAGTDFSICAFRFFVFPGGRHGHRHFCLRNPQSAGM